MQKMGGYEYRNHHIVLQKKYFMPILCTRTSIKDAKLSKYQDLSEEPASPRVGCMGQVKRNNKVIGFPIYAAHKPTTATSSAVSSTHGGANTYFKLKRFLSSKSLISTSTPAATKTSCATTKRRVVVKRSNEVDNKFCHRGKVESFVKINVDELDPPLPVTKREQKKCEDGMSLWKRRSGGVALNSLQVQQFHHCHHLQLQPTSV